MTTPQQRQYPWWIIGVGAVLLIMSIVSVTFTAVRNYQRAGLIQCAQDTVKDIREGLQNRDKTRIAFDNAAKELAIYRAQLLLVMNGVQPDPNHPITLQQALDNYRATAPMYLTAIDDDIVAARNAPIPRSCIGTGGARGSA